VKETKIAFDRVRFFFICVRSTQKKIKLCLGLSQLADFAFLADAISKRDFR
jgi:hypothetical protein